MSKLIYVDRLKKDILALQDCYNGFSDTYDKACIIGVIDEQPTIDERKTGRWIAKEDLKQFFCDQCGEPSLTYDDIYIYGMDFPNFCPACGADMREVEHD